MFTKEQFIQSISHETNVIKHLCTKFTTGDADFTPGDKMRSTLELMQYLTMCGVGPLKSCANNNWDLARAYLDEVAKFGFDEIPDALDTQLNDMLTTLGDISESDFQDREVSFPWGGSATLGQALIDTTLKFMTAYRMQLFLYAKLNGRTELNTMNCWAGVDAG